MHWDKVKSLLVVTKATPKAKDSLQFDNQPTRQHIMLLTNITDLGPCNILVGLPGATLNDNSSCYQICKSLIKTVATIVMVPYTIFKPL